jgi:hypothetical protein
MLQTCTENTLSALTDCYSKGIQAYTVRRFLLNARSYNIKMEGKLSPAFFLAPVNMLLVHKQGISDWFSNY